MTRPDNNLLIARIAKVLRAGESSVSEIIRRLGCSESATRRNLRTLRAAGTIHIGEYRTGSNNCTEIIYRWGPGEDAEDPAASIRTPAPAMLPPVPKLGPWGCVW